MKKRILGLLLGSVCVLSLASCFGGKTPTQTTTANPTTTDVVTPTTTTTDVVIPTTTPAGTTTTAEPVVTTTTDTPAPTTTTAEPVTTTTDTPVTTTTTGPVQYTYAAPTYAWEGANCTATRVCEQDSSRNETETVTGTYVKDSDASCTESEAGHYTATFTNSAFEAQSTAANSVSKGNPLGHAIESVAGLEPGATTAGFKAYYQCSRCNEYFEDEAGTTPIADLAAWKAEGGRGYIAPLTEHKEFETPEIEGELDPSHVSVQTKHLTQTNRVDGPLGQEDAFPSLSVNGQNPTMLVIPVNLDNSKKTDAIYNNIKTAFEGTSEETGWESVKTFYNKSSYGKLTIEFEFTPWFTPSKTSSEYENDYYLEEYEQYYGDSIVLEEAIAYFDSTYDFSKYDFDNDGKVDNIWLVYNCPVEYEGSGLYWAWQTKYEDDNGDTDTLRADGKIISRYGWAGTDFMDPTKESDNYNKENIIVDAHTFIHESGHIMGLEDYYDYDDKVGVVDRGLFGADMMDYNVGDHCSFNKLSLGWIDPTIVTGSGVTELTLESFTETGKVLLISNHNIDTLWDEYFLVEFYTNTGLNANDCPIGNSSTMGIRIIHVDAHLALDAQGNKTYNDDDSYPGTGFKYDNTGTDYPLIEMLRADSGASSFPDITSSSLFTASGKTFGVDTHSTFKLNDGTALFFTLSVKSISNGQCTVEISLD
ncbi:MAG: hypothetical protein IJU60_04375 [Acholeplasmatales bacterium]|nr:hypothetical protein [Acholeplasmatales bacterium]